MYQQPTFLDPSSGVQVVNSTVEMADITGLHPGVTYNFTVVAFNEIGDSTPSDTASVSTAEEGMLVSSFSPPTPITASSLLCSTFWLPSKCSSSDNICHGNVSEVGPCTRDGTQRSD